MIVVTEIQRDLRRIVLRNGSKKLLLTYKKFPKDIDLLLGKVVELSNNAVYLNDDMIAWITDSKDLTIDWMVSSIQESLECT